jgi:hypothetical protein
MFANVMPAGVKCCEPPPIEPLPCPINRTHTVGAATTACSIPRQDLHWSYGTLSNTLRYRTGLLRWWDGFTWEERSPYWVTPLLLSPSVWSHEYVFLFCGFGPRIRRHRLFLDDDPGWHPWPDVFTDDGTNFTIHHPGTSGSYMSGRGAEIWDPASECIPFDLLYTSGGVIWNAHE